MTWEAWLGADTPVSANLRTGAVMPLTRSATGQVFLAFLPAETTAPWLKRELADHLRQGLTPTSREEVEQLSAQIRRRGIARTGELIPGISGMAAPVFDHSGSVVLSLVVLGYSKPFEAQGEAIFAALRDHAARLSRRLGAPKAT
jgi:DNA-binding IclR family transcriptional regulator